MNEQEQTKEITKAEPQDIVMAEPTIMMLAQNPDFPVEKLEALIKMKNDEEDRQAKKDFEFNFAEMQKEFKPIKRSKKGDKGKYAPVDVLVKQYGPIITKHGFSFSWDEEPQENNKLKVILTISGYGYSKANTKILPEYIPDKGNQSGKSIMNSLQAEGTRSTYGYRYTFKAGFGITETDEDTDGEYLNNEKYKGYFDRMVSVKNNHEALLKCCENCKAELEKKGDKVGVQMVRTFYARLRESQK